MNEYEGHRARHKKRFRDFGLRQMADHEVLELLLFYAIPRSDTRKLAHRLLRQFGSLYGVFHASVGELCAVDGVGESTALLLTLMLPLWQRMNLSAPCERVLDGSQAIGRYFCNVLSGLRHEQLYAAAIDAKGQLIACRCVNEGGRNSVSVDLRALTEFASNSGASYIALAHNHPSGVASASAEDINTTRCVRYALLPYNIRVVDHVIVTDHDFISMRETHMID